MLAAWLETLTALPKSRLPRGTTSALPVLAVLSLPSAFIDHAPTFSSFVYRLTVSVVGLTLTAVVTSALLRPHARAMVALRCKSPCGRRQEAGESLPQTLRVKADEISLEEPLGAGSFGEVFRGRWRNTQVAVKKLRSELSEAAMRGFASEATLMQGLRHPNIVLFMALSPSPPLIVLEYMSRGSLYHALHSQRVRLSWHARLRMLADAAAGMAYLHQHQPPIVHLDLKSPNLLLDDSWRCKVSDFGQSKLRRPTGDRARQGGFGSDMYLSPKQRGGDLGSVLWSAPEAFQGEQVRPTAVSRPHPLHPALTPPLSLPASWACTRTCTPSGSCSSRCCCGRCPSSPFRRCRSPSRLRGACGRWIGRGSQRGRWFRQRCRDSSTSWFACRRSHPAAPLHGLAASHSP